MDGACHERRVLDHVGEDDELGGTVAVDLGRAARALQNRLRREEHGIHVDASPRRGDVERRAHALRRGERFGDGVDELAVGRADALLHERGEASHEVDAEGLGRAVHGAGDGGEVGGGAGGGDLRDRRDRDALVGDGDAVLALEVLRGGDEVLGRVRDLVVDLLAHAVHVLVRASHERDAHGDGTQVEVLLGDHGESLGDFPWGDVHVAPFVLV